MAVLELGLASIIWGASFTLVHWALEDFSTSSLVFWRFGLAFVIGEAISYLGNRESFQKSHQDIPKALIAGLFLGLSILLQTHGLRLTSATNSSFITSMYVVIVPLVAFIFFKQKIKASHFFLGLSAFIGMGLLLKFHTLQEFTLNSFNFGDFLTLLCAIASSFHIIFVGKSAKNLESSFRFNNYQNFWSLFFIIPFLIYEINFKNLSILPSEWHIKSVISVLVLSLFVSLFAFYLQVRAQKILTTTTASLLCLLEAPNAFLFATLFLNEKIDTIQAVGVVIILLSSFFSVYVDRPQNRSH